MRGYYNDDEGTAKAFRGGWFHSGDLAVRQPDGAIELRDRQKNIIISGGENISTIEVEQAVASHPAVLECAVVAAPDPKWGEVPKAFVTLKPDQTAASEAIIAHCRGRLAHFKCPKVVEFGDLAQDVHRQGPEVRAARARMAGLHEADQLSARLAPGCPSRKRGSLLPGNVANCASVRNRKPPWPSDRHRSRSTKSNGVGERTKPGEPTRPVECPLPLDAGVDRQALAGGEFGVDGGRVDAGVAELLLDLAQRGALADLIDGCPMAEVPARGGPHLAVAATTLMPAAIAYRRMSRQQWP